MKLFDILKAPNIKENLKEYESAEEDVLFDVRNEEEYALDHISKSKNIPVQAIDKAGKFIRIKDVPIFVYCKSGSRSSMAQGILKNMDYNNLKNISKILNYSNTHEC